MIVAVKAEAVRFDVSDIFIFRLSVIGEVALKRRKPSSSGS